jgi:hypothetical protein
MIPSAVMMRVRGRLCTVGRTNFVEDIADMARNCVRADAKRVGNFTVALTSSNQLQYFDFAR